MHKPTALQRLAQELKTFDWHHDPADKTSKASKQETKIRKLVAQCKEEEVRDLWNRVAPTAKFPAPFGLKPIKQPKEPKRKRLLKGEMPVHPTKTYERHQQLGLPDINGEVSRWQIECALLKAASENDCSVPEVAANEKLLKKYKLKGVIIPQSVIDDTERDRRNYAATMLNVHRSGATRMMAEAVMKNELKLDDVMQRYGEQFARRIQSEIGRIKDEKVAEQYKQAEKAKQTGEAKPKKEKADKPAAKAVSSKDRFGCREGSQAAIINACINSKPTSLDAIVKQTGFGLSRVRGHLKFLVEKGFAKETKQGYTDANGKPAAQATQPAKPVKEPAKAKPAASKPAKPAKTAVKASSKPAKAKTKAKPAKQPAKPSKPAKGQGKAKAAKAKKR